MIQETQWLLLLRAHSVDNVHWTLLLSAACNVFSYEP